MILSRRLFAAETIGGLCLAVTLGTRGVAFAQSSAEANVTAADVQIDLFRGLANVFSRGMDTLTQRLNRQGYSARVHSTNGWRTTVRRISEGYSRGRRSIIILIGHSLGANATIQAANELNREQIPVALIVTFDPTQALHVPSNVSHLVNFYQNNGFGRRLSPGPGFHGELTNVNLTADRSLSHTTIDEAPRLHAQVTQQIANLVKQKSR